MFKQTLPARQQAIRKVSNYANYCFIAAMQHKHKFLFPAQAQQLALPNTMHTPAANKIAADNAKQITLFKPATSEKTNPNVQEPTFIVDSNGLRIYELNVSSLSYQNRESLYQAFSKHNIYAITSSADMDFAGLSFKGSEEAFTKSFSRACQDFHQQRDMISTINCGVGQTY